MNPSDFMKITVCVDEDANVSRISASAGHDEEEKEISFFCKKPRNSLTVIVSHGEPPEECDEV